MGERVAFESHVNLVNQWENVLVLNANWRLHKLIFCCVCLQGMALSLGDKINLSQKKISK